MTKENSESKIIDENDSGSDDEKIIERVKAKIKFFDSLQEQLNNKKEEQECSQ